MLAEYRAKKRLGQNFLKSDKVIARIVDLVNPAGQPHVVEIGAGRGAITLPLAESGRSLTAVEFDRDLINYLDKLLADFSQVEIINRDFLTIEPDEFGHEKFFLVGNLPYNITSPVLDWTVRNRGFLTGALFMVQRELADRITARPPGRGWSPLSLFTQLYFETEPCFTVNPGCFVPPPRVSSAVIRLSPKQVVPVRYPVQLEQVVRQSFERRRKLLVNNLVPGLIERPDDLLSILNRLDLSRNIRAEQMSTEQFISLTEHLVECGLI